MASRDPENKAGEKLFKNPVLEILTKSTPTTILMTYIPLIVVMISFAVYKGYVSSIGEVLGLFWGAFLVWTLFEYLMHRFVFHLMEDSPKYHRAYYLLHGIHHDFPRDPKRLFMPPVAGLTIAAIFFALFYLIMGVKTFVFLPGFVLGYVAYTMVHYSIHRFKPPFKWLEPIWKHHHLHRFRYPEKAFGVSSFFWDKIFMTMPKESKQKPVKKEVRSREAA